ncbi:MAGUK p55 subfamily member 2 isoform X11 [Rhinolophus sinicus]
MVAQQGLLHVGDIIKEVNGQPVGSDPRALQELLRSASGSVILKILPSYQEPHLPRQVFVKCHFDYDPARDSLIPCKEAGLRFTAGDLLQIVNQDDANWWQAELCPRPFQACHVEGGSAGLIPSQLLEEKRKAFVKRDLELTPTSGTLCGSLSGKKKKRMMYLTTKNAEFDRHELLIYEEVARMPPFRRKTLVLIGAQGVGRRSLKNKLIMWDPDRYGTTVPYTSRRPKDSEREGQGYSFVSRAEMEADIRAGRYLEHGEYEGNLYGTRIDSIRGVVAAGKVCVLDVNPQAVKVLRTAEFVPYVVFIEAPDFETLRAMNRAALESGVSTKQLTEADLRRTVEESSRIQRCYGHYFDLSLVNSNLERTFRELQTAMEKLRTEPQCCSLLMPISHQMSLSEDQAVPRSVSESPSKGSVQRREKLLWDHVVNRYTALCHLSLRSPFLLWTGHTHPIPWAPLTSHPSILGAGPKLFPCGLGSG